MDPADFSDFVERNALKVTPHDLKELTANMPALRDSFPKVEAPGFPNYREQLEFLSVVVEDFAKGRLDELPYSVACEAMFALLYLHREVDVIPDFVREIGYTDDAAVAAVTLQRNAAHFEPLAQERNFTWSEIAPVALDI